MPIVQPPSPDRLPPTDDPTAVDLTCPQVVLGAPVGAPPGAWPERTPPGGSWPDRTGADLTGRVAAAAPTSAGQSSAAPTAVAPTAAEARGTAVRPPTGALRRWGRAVGRMWSKIWTDRVLGMSAEAGFWGLVSLPALLLAVFGGLGFFGGDLGHDTLSRVHDDVLRVAGDVLSATTVRDDVAPLLARIFDRGQGAVASVSFGISLWSGSTATAAYVNTITVAYGMRGIRGALRSRIVALGIYLLAVLTGVVILPALILGPDAIVDLTPGLARLDVARLVSLSYWPALVVVSVVVIATLYRLSLPVRVRWRSHLPGAVLAMLIWLAGSIGVRAYVAYSARTGNAYGALAGPLAALLFFYVTALAVLLGAELNAALRAERADEAGSGPDAGSGHDAAAGAGAAVGADAAGGGPAE
jgi:membrane protein